jgi:hypothetical protein
MNKHIQRHLLQLAIDSGDEEAIAFYSTHPEVHPSTKRTCLDMGAITKIKLAARKTLTPEQKAYLRRQGESK